jgi:glutamate racemase
MKVFFERLFLVFLIFSPTSALSNDCDIYKDELKSDSEYRITFGDSGVGGLIFALDVADELQKKLKKLETEYKVKFVFDHLGDSKNAPYGSKNPEEIRELTEKFLSYQLDLPNTKTSVVACNTASTVVDEKMTTKLKENHSDIAVITMIEDSSRALLEVANDNKPKDYIAILATPATIKSQSYQNEIKKLDKTGKFKLYSYSPQNWVKNVETGAKKEVADAELERDLEIFKNQIGENFKKIKAVGLFCTHYPFYKKEIAEFFAQNGNKEVKILTQGHIFSQKIYSDILRNLKNDKTHYSKRTKKLPYQCANDVELVSRISGNNVEETKNVIRNTHPQYVDKISFHKISIK